ncbi:MAG: hypothetical protein A2951_02650 [Candidatus Buchananbacteria bacterium RIFCSPLOWO2_01_FULL_56_15]|uniref:Uncharacterized protein n=2 Tax=Candidatus Buchananiibacteriota TaxID=1817903 RepID=A0A1G1YEE5_9BACT|nr:MAG: hypothetical protein A3J59_00800 [Candidatus Buchananbacteria bacterium RIFCSPHIGHO2_02_FULL_56_16]OGY54592.1 MAG: hypothetical protein A2951_02650 [Candidatus Buchananbacteria bacterium RIFCSPLOWO2_01_FULL_56_15]
MLETSKDLLYVVIAFCVLWLTVFICWAMYYMISMLRTMHHITSGVREKLDLVDKILKLVKDKLEKGSNHMAVIADSVIKLVGLAMEKQQKKAAGKKQKR